MNYHIDRLDGSCPVQAEGTIEDTYRFYFRGRSGRWQFVAGPSSLDTDALVYQMLAEQGDSHFIGRDSRVMVLQGDDPNEAYLDETYKTAQQMISICVQVFAAWLRIAEEKEQAR